MGLTPPTIEETESAILAIWKGLRPNADSQRYSDLWLFKKILGRIVTRIHQTYARAVNALMPDSTFGSYLDRWLYTIGAPNDSGGYGRIQDSTTDDIADGLTVTAEAGGAIAANSLVGKTLQDTGNRAYVITDAAHGAIPAGTSDTLDIQSTSTGVECNLEVGDILTFDSPPAFCEEEATIAVRLTGATTRETDPQGLARLIRFFQYPPTSGNVADWVRVIEAVDPGNLTAFIYPKRELQPYGYGRTDYLALFTNETAGDKQIGSGTTTYTAIATAVADELPALLARNSRQLTIFGVATDVDVTITLSDDATSDQKCDWDAETGVNITVSSHDAGGVPNKEIVASAAVAAASRTNGMLAGDRVVIDGVEATVDKCGLVDGLANDSTFRLTYWPYPTGAAALNGLFITSGGGLIGHIAQTDANGDNIAGSGCVDTIRSYMDLLGPAKGTYAAGSQIPNWDDTARVLHIQSDVVQFGDGSIVDCTINDIGGGGAADKVPTPGSGATTQRLYYREITVWQVFV